MKQVYSTIWRGLLGVAFLLISMSARAQVSGTVFRDVNGSGTRTTSNPDEPGALGVTVRAYVNFLSTPVSTTTDASGNYAFTAAQIPAGARVRIEFADFYRGDFVGPANNGGNGTQTNLRFLTAPATGVDCGINYPKDFCQDGPLSIVIPCFVNGDPLMTTDRFGAPVSGTQAASSGDVVVAFNYDASGIASPTNFYPIQVANAGQVGSVWGTTVLRAEKKVLSAANIKRHAGLGTLGTGGIYISDVSSLSPTSTTILSNPASVTTAPFVDFQADLGINTGANPHTGLSGSKLDPSADPASMTAVGRVGFGGITLSDDARTLYAVNLFDRKLYGVFINSPARKPGPADVQSWALNQAACPNGDYRPWAISSYRGYVYVGGVCSGENRTSRIGSTASALGDLQATLPDTAGLRIIIQRIDPATVSGNVTTVLDYPLTFQRGPADLTGSCIEFKYWLPWNNNWPQACAANFVMWPQPILSDLEFRSDGSVVMGFMDRFGMMAGQANFDPSGNGSYDGFTGGDMHIAASLNRDFSAFRMESNGTYGGPGTLSTLRTATSGTVPGTSITVQGVGNGQGPGGGEFFFMDQWALTATSTTLAHDEVLNGSVIVVPGKGETLSSAYDPITAVWKSGGLKTFSNRTGINTRNYSLYSFGAPGTFGKASGLGDGSALCEVAAVEIGNRVWFDDNRDGIQNAYEPGVDGIALRLFDMSTGPAGTLVASTTTANGGQYVFNASNVPGGLVFGRAYQVRLPMSQLPALDLSATRPAGGPQNARRAATAKTPLAQNATTATRQYFLSPAFVNTGTDSDIRDNNATLIGPDAVVSTTAGGSGQNGYGNDFSVYSCPVLEAIIPTLTVCAGASSIPDIPVAGQNFALVDSLRYVVFTSPQSGTAMYNTSPGSGTVLGTYAPSDPRSTTISLQAAGISTANSSTAPITYYVYGIIAPTPQDVQCRVSMQTTVSISPQPNLVVSAVSTTLTCSTTAVALNAIDPTPGATYAWITPGTNATTAGTSVTATQPGTYTLTGRVNGCTVASTTANVVADQTPGSIAVSSGTLTCAQTSVTLSSTVSQGYTSLRWTGPNGFTANTPSITVSTPGQYSVAATFGNGCISAAAVATAVQADTTPPSLSATGGLLPCTTCSTTITASFAPPGTSVRWSGPGGFSSTQATATISTAGVYTVVATAPNGCPISATVAIQVAASIGDYVWYDNNRNGIQDNRINPFTNAIIGPELPVPGVRIVLYNADTNQKLDSTLTNASGFYSFTGLAPGNYYLMTRRSTFPDANYEISPTDAGGNDALDSDFPTGTYRTINTTLTSGEADMTWDMGLWRNSSPSIMDPCACNDDIYYGLGFNQYFYGETVDVKSGPGEFWYVIPGPDPATGLSTTGIQVNDAFGRPQVYTAGMSVSLVETTAPGSATANYRLTFGHLENAGYSIVVTNGRDILSIQNRCFNAPIQTTPTSVTLCKNSTSYPLQTTFTTGTTTYHLLRVNPAFRFPTNGELVVLPPLNTLPVITQVDPRLYNSGDTLVIVSRWQPGPNQPNAPNGQPYGTCGVTIIENLIISIPAPTLLVSPAATTLTCTNTSAVLTLANPNPSGTYRWTAPNSTTSTGTSLTVTQAGIYTVVGTSVLDCAVGSGTVVTNQIPGSASITTGTLSCLTPTVTLTATVTGSYSVINWTGPSSITATGPTLTVSQPGLYRALVTYTNGCVDASNAANVTQGNTTPPALDAFGGAKLCPTCSVTLVAIVDDAANTTFRWSGPNSFSSSLQRPVVSDVGNYTISITDRVTGCTNASIVVVEEPSNDCPGLTLDTPQAANICSGDRLPTITVSISQIGQGQQIRFALFTTQPDPGEALTGGTLLGIVTPDNTLKATLVGSSLPPLVNPSYEQRTYYVYAVVIPQDPAEPICDPAITVIKVGPGACVPISVVRVR
jgi:hypothetical protein